MLQSKAMVALMRLKEIDRKYRIKQADDKHVRNQVSSESSFDEFPSSRNRAITKKDDNNKKKLDIQMPITTTVKDEREFSLGKKELSSLSVSSSGEVSKAKSKSRGDSSGSSCTLIESLRSKRSISGGTEVKGLTPRSSAITSHNEIEDTTIEEDIETIDEDKSSVPDEEFESKGSSIKKPEVIERVTANLSGVKTIISDNKLVGKNKEESDAVETNEYYTNDTFENVSSSQMLSASTEEEDRLEAVSVNSASVEEEDGSTIQGVKQIDIVPHTHNARRYVSRQKSSRDEKTRVEKQVIELVPPKPIEAVVSECELDLDKDLSDYVKTVESTGKNADDVEPICLLKQSRGTSASQSKRRKDQRQSSFSRSESKNGATSKSESIGATTSKADREAFSGRSNLESTISPTSNDRNTERSVSKVEKNLRNLIYVKKTRVTKSRAPSIADDHNEQILVDRDTSRTGSRMNLTDIENEDARNEVDLTVLSDSEKSIKVSLEDREQAKIRGRKSVEEGKGHGITSNERLEENARNTSNCQSSETEASAISDKELVAKRHVTAKVEDVASKQKGKRIPVEDVEELLETLSNKFSESLLEKLKPHTDVTGILRKLNREAINALFQKSKAHHQKNHEPGHSSRPIRIYTESPYLSDEEQKIVDNVLHSDETKRKKLKKKMQRSKLAKVYKSIDLGTKKNRTLRLENKHILELRKEMAELKREREEMRDYIFKFGQIRSKFASDESYKQLEDIPAIKPLDFPNIADFNRPDISNLRTNDKYDVHRERILSIRQWMKDQYIFYRGTSDTAQILNTKYIPTTLEDAKKVIRELQRTATVNEN